MSEKNNILDAKKYFISLLLLLLGLTVAQTGILMLMNSYFSWSLSIPCFFLFLGVEFYILTSKLMSSVSEGKFMSYYLAILFGKFLLSVLAIAFYLTMIKEQKGIFVVCFFIYYIVFSVFETSIFLRINKKDKSGE